MAAFRDAAWNLSPPRLRTLRAAKLIYAMIGVPLDDIMEAATQAVTARFPSRCPDDALPYHAADRSIARGPLEPADSFRARLTIWLDSWASAAIGRSMLGQLAGYITPRTCRMRIITQGGLVYTREADGSFSIVRAAGSWNWDGATASWARFFVVIYPGADLWQREGAWNGGGTWGDGGTWGSTATPAEVASVRQVVRDWKPAASRCESIIVSFDDSLFDAAMTAWPDGLWGDGRRASGGTNVYARNDGAIYWDGV